MQSDLLTDAIWRGDIALVRDLIAHGAALDDVDSKGWTPLMQASEAEDLAIIALLLRSGADPNRQGNGGTTPLHIAVDIAIDGTMQNGYRPGDEPIHTVKMLMEAGANVSASDHRGHSPLDLAREYRSERIIATLLGHQ